MKKLLLSLIMLCAPLWAGTHYVSTSGSDSANGTSESTPWAHLPGMKTWTGSYTPVAGDTFVLRGCDDWGNSNFPLAWTWSGSSGSHITITVDQTWYNTTNCPSAWNRPIFDAGGSSINAPDCPGGSGSHYMMTFSSVQYVDLHWIEMKGLYWNNDQQSACFQSVGFIYDTQSDYLLVDNFYIHGWTHGTSAGTTDSSNLIAYTTYGTAPYCFNCTLQNSVIDNSDGDGASTSTYSGGGPRNWGNILNNVFSHMVQAVLTPMYATGTMTIAGNNINNIGLSFTTPSQSAPPHPNCIETTGMVGGTGTVLVHDNYIHAISGCEGMQVGNPNESDYVFNNIWDMGASAVAGVNGPQVPQGSSSGNFFFVNNTVRWASGCMVAGGHGASFSSFVVKDNHCINDNTTIVNGTIPGSSISSNIGQTNANATTQGYTSSETYVFSPTAGTNSTVGAGTNLTSTSPGCGTSGLSSLCSDTVYAVSEQTVSGVVQVVASGRTINSRPSSGAWDAGAYEYSSAPTYTVTASLAGTGSGTITGGSINCGSTCTESGITLGTVLTLSESAASGSSFAGWSGTCGCTGTGTCAPTITASCTVVGTFNTVPTYTLTVNNTGTAIGTVTSNDLVINCGSTCSESGITSGRNIVLTAAPLGGYSFTGWSGGGCSGTGTCSVTVTANTTVTASFAPTTGQPGAAFSGKVTMSGSAVIQ